MKSDKLALLGGSKTIKEPFKPYNPYGLEEINAAKSVIETGILLSIWQNGEMIFSEDQWLKNLKLIGKNLI